MTDSPTSPGGAWVAGMVSPDYTGSYEEWVEMVTRDLVREYVMGRLTSSVTDIGVADPADKGAALEDPDHAVSYQTWMFWENYVKKYGDESAYIQENYGSPPERHATYVEDPNSPAAIQGSFEERSQFEAEEAAKDRAAAERRAQIGADATVEAATISADASIKRTTMQVESDWKIANLQDATRRYIAEGDWGVQKWVTRENNQAAMDRLKLQLGFNEKELAQRAIEEKNRHQETLVGLALEVAKYDAELVASPRNWLKYAAWLQTRNVPINGMTLAMSAQEVPEDEIDPATVAEATGSTLAGIEVSKELASGQSGGSTLAGQSPEQQKQAAQIAQQYGVDPQRIQYGADNRMFDINQQGDQLGQFQQAPGVEELDQADPAQLARDLLGMNPAAASEQDASQQNLQQIASGLSTSGRDVASFGAYGGPTRNALGVEVPEVSGKDVDYREFTDLLPSEQQAKIGAVESVRGPYGVTDYVEEMERSRPKGQRRSTAFG